MVFLVLAWGYSGLRKESWRHSPNVMPPQARTSLQAQRPMVSSSRIPCYHSSFFIYKDIKERRQIACDSTLEAEIRIHGSERWLDA